MLLLHEITLIFAQMKIKHSSKITRILAHFSSYFFLPLMELDPVIVSGDESCVGADSRPPLVVGGCSGDGKEDRGLG
jgi:hypothetical protein